MRHLRHLEEDICPVCSGSGEGMTEGSTCRSCKGTGTIWVEIDDDEPTEGEDDE